jgi:integrase-like protein
LADLGPLVQPPPDAKPRLVGQLIQEPRPCSARGPNRSSASAPGGQRVSVGRPRDERLNEYWFTSLGDARRTVEEWRQDDNAVRPHSALGHRTPIEPDWPTRPMAATLPIPAGLSQ